MSPPLKLLTLLLCLGVTGCMKRFGPKFEVLDAAVTKEHILQIESLSRIDLPEGTAGLAYLYDASGIDPWFEAKLKIPADKAQTLLKSLALQESFADSPDQATEEHQKWWRPEELSLLDQGSTKNQNPHVDYFFGEQGADYILYIRWVTF